MGVFMSGVAFRVTQKNNWPDITPRIEALFKGLEGLTDNLDSDGPGYGIVSPYGDMGMFLSELPEKISALTGDYAVFATCCDSDFNLLELYCNGTQVEKSYVGRCFRDYGEMGDYGKPVLSNWLPLLADPKKERELKKALGKVWLFAENNLRHLSEATCLPIFDDGLVFGKKSEGRESDPGGCPPSF